MLTLNAEQVKALKDLLEYNWREELEDYKDNLHKNHIFEQIVLLDQAVYRHTNTAADFAKGSV